MVYFNIIFNDFFLASLMDTLFKFVMSLTKKYTKKNVNKKK